jgi:hypothetical protein
MSDAEFAATYAALTTLASCAGEAALSQAAERLRTMAAAYPGPTADDDLRGADELDRLRDFYAVGRCGKEQP